MTALCLPGALGKLGSVPNWVIRDVLATSPRPGYVSGSEVRVHAGVVDEWLLEVLEFGIRSVICLIDRSQLWLYDHAIPEGLLTRYRQAGLEVAHVPTPDQQTIPFTPEQYEAALRAFLELPKPVLVHCSAGMDRTGRVVGHILATLEGSDHLAP
jgi:protein tyrosine phosphatase (PTP) superfamily phosphohydrolase (DUF442 family)